MHCLPTKKYFSTTSLNAMLFSTQTQNFFKKFPQFTDLKYEVAADVAKLWIKASLPILLKSRIETKLFDIVNKLRAAEKSAFKSQSQPLTATWLFELLDISACKCKSSANPNMQFWNGKFVWACPFEHRIPAEEIDLLRDHRVKI